MTKPRFHRRFRFGQIEWYSHRSFFLTVWCRGFEVQVNQWPPRSVES